MHPNRHYRKTQESRNIAFVRERAFGVLTVNGETHPLTSSIPALLCDDGSELEFHLVNSNPLARVLQKPTPAVFLVSGPDSYVSPDWYGVEDQVPTWNYVAVRLEGIVEPLAQTDLLPLLDRLSAHFENQLLPKPPWMSSKVSDAAMNKLLRAISPFIFSVSKIESTWKLNQTKTEQVRLSAAGQIETTGLGQSLGMLAEYMRDPEV